VNLPVDTDSDDLDIDTDSDARDDASLESEARFAGDTGTLPVPARRVLVRLLQGPSLDARRHEKLWTILKGARSWHGLCGTTAINREDYGVRGQPVAGHGIGASPI